MITLEKDISKDKPEVKDLFKEEVKGSRVRKGNKIDKVTILEKTDIKNKNKKYFWKCMCDCGNEVLIIDWKLRYSKNISCGCKIIGKENRKNERLYGIWRDMKQRCDNPKCKNYRYYGAKGITYHKNWENYDNFYDWAMKSGYKENLTIDRINVFGNYDPDNCKWSTREEQDRNKRNTIYINIKGEKMTMSEISKKYNLNYTCIRHRYHTGIRDERILKPSIRGKKNEQI